MFKGSWEAQLEEIQQISEPSQVNPACRCVYNINVAEGWIKRDSLMAVISTGLCIPKQMIPGQADRTLQELFQKDTDLQRVSKLKVCSGAWDNCYMNREPERRTERKRSAC